MKRGLLGATLGALVVIGATGSLMAQAKPAATKPPVMGAQPAGPEPAAPVQTGELNLGSVRIPAALKADGKPLPPGTYQVRLTPQEAGPPVVGQTPSYERWVEFVQSGQVKGREVVSIFNKSDVGKIAEGTPPAAGRAKVETLKGGDYVRVWILRGDNHYLIHLVNSAPTN